MHQCNWLRFDYFMPIVIRMQYFSTCSRTCLAIQLACVTFYLFKFWKTKNSGTLLVEKLGLDPAYVFGTLAHSIVSSYSTNINIQVRWISFNMTFLSILIIIIIHQFSSQQLHHKHKHPSTLNFIDFPWISMIFEWCWQHFCDHVYTKQTLLRQNAENCVTIISSLMSTHL